MTTTPEPRLTVAEYLQRDRQAEVRSDFLRGVMIPAQRTTISHNMIKSNLVGGIGGRLRDGPYWTLSSTQRVSVPRVGFFSYPDLLILRGPFQESPDDRDTLTNPQVIIEVLSPATEAYDRGVKFANYRKLDSLLEYVLVLQDQMHIDRFVRQADETWVLTSFADPDADFALATVEARVPLRDIYAGVEFQPPSK